MTDIGIGGITVEQMISVILIAIGMVIIGRALVLIPKVYDEVKNPQKKKYWRIIHVMLYVLLLGYGVALSLVYLDGDKWIELLLGSVFALGALFSWLMLRIAYETLNDLTARKGRYTHLVNEVKDYAIIMLDSKGFVWSWNKGAEQIKGYSSEEAIWLDFRNFYTPEDRKAGKPDLLLAEAAANGRANDEGWRVKKDGSRFWANVSLTSSRDKKGQVVSYSKVTRDLTERKLLEETQEQNITIIKAKNKELEQFTYIASHDLQEPLSTLRSLVDILLDEDLKGLNDEAKEVLGYVEDTTNRMTELVKGLLDHGRIGSTKKTCLVDLNKLVVNALADLRASIDVSEAKIIVGELPEVIGSEVDLRLLFQNLIGNAIKFRHQDRTPEILIGAIEYENEYKFTVSDNGIGIKNEDLDKIFVIFQRLHEREEFAGTGIGLAHCKKIVDVHGGRIWASSELGKGSLFNFTVPKYKELDAREV